MTVKKAPRKRATPNANHYVDNKAMYAALVEYRQQVQQARDAEQDIPQIPEYIGECIYRIANRLASKSNFFGYAFRDEMESDAIENCIQYLHSFDPSKSKNPFAYFTQVCNYAFIRRIKQEKKQTYTKIKYALHQSHQHLDYVTQDGQSVNIGDPTWATYDNIQEFIRDYEAKTTRTRPADSKEDSVPEDVVPFDILDEETSGVEEDFDQILSEDDPKEL